MDQAQVQLRDIVSEPLMITWEQHGFCEQHGGYFHCHPLPPELPQMKMSMCYANAARTVMSQPDQYVYVEGYAMDSQIPFGFSHAWVYDFYQDKAFDPTWRVHDLQDPIYLGVPIKWDYLKSFLWRRKKYASLVDNWEDRFPLHTMPPDEWRDERVTV